MQLRNYELIDSQAKSDAYIRDLEQKLNDEMARKSQAQPDAYIRGLEQKLKDEMDRN